MDRQRMQSVHQLPVHVCMSEASLYLDFMQSQDKLLEVLLRY